MNLSLESTRKTTVKRSPVSALLLMLFGLALLLGQVSVSKGDEWEYKLTHAILEGYDNSIRPSKHHNLTLNVTFGLSLTQIIDVV